MRQVTLPWVSTIDFTPSSKYGLWFQPEQSMADITPLT